MNVFMRDKGVHQGRIRKENAPEGAHVYELGHALLHEAEVVVGDMHEVATTFVRDAGSLYVRATIVVNAPIAPPVLAAWEVSGWLNGVKLVSRKLRANKRAFKLDDWRISLANSNPPPATNTLAFRLELVGVP